MSHYFLSSPSFPTCSPEVALLTISAFSSSDGCNHNFPEREGRLSSEHEGGSWALEGWTWNMWAGSLVRTSVEKRGAPSLLVASSNLVILKLTPPVLPGNSAKMQILQPHPRIYCIRTYGGSTQQLVFQQILEALLSCPQVWRARL